MENTPLELTAFKPLVNNFLRFKGENNGGNGRALHLPIGYRVNPCFIFNNAFAIRMSKISQFKKIPQKS